MSFLTSSKVEHSYCICSEEVVSVQTFPVLNDVREAVYLMSLSVYDNFNKTCYFSFHYFEETGLWSCLHASPALLIAAHLVKVWSGITGSNFSCTDLKVLLFFER